MSVIVKGMKMPKSCSKCGWFDMGGGDGYRCTLLRKSFDMWNKISVARDKNCPLIEIPTPHGRLIDIKSVEDNKFAIAENDLQRWWNGAIDSIIDNAPTVIEAEGSDE